MIEFLIIGWAVIAITAFFYLMVTIWADSVRWHEWVTPLPFILALALTWPLLLIAIGFAELTDDRE